MKDHRGIKMNKKLEKNQVFKISRFKEVIKRTRPHKHDGYFELIYLSEGAGFHWIDTEKFQIRPPVVYFLSGQLHCWEMTAIPRGFVLLFKDDFFDAVHDSSLMSLVLALERNSEISLPESENLGLLLQEMEKECKDPTGYTKQLTQGYLQVILAKLLSLNQHLSKSGNEVDRQLRKFQRLLQASHPIFNLKVRDLADKMNLSPQQLNSFCRKVAGRSASELISEQVILEAKRYILHTDKSISEISHALKFTDPSHFNKYFKKRTGQTPQLFRAAFQ